MCHACTFRCDERAVDLESGLDAEIEAYGRIIGEFVKSR
jgi:hypothetical protein